MQVLIFIGLKFVELTVIVGVYWVLRQAGMWGMRKVAGDSLNWCERNCFAPFFGGGAVLLVTIGIIGLIVALSQNWEWAGRLAQ